MPPDNDLIREPTIFSAVLTPHRSLSRKGFLALMLVAGGISLVTGTTFLLAGAWPVFGFCGLDVLLLYWALKLSYRRRKRPVGGNSRERILPNRPTARRRPP